MDVGVKVVRTLDSLFSVQVLVWCIDRKKKKTDVSNHERHFLSRPFGLRAEKIRAFTVVYKVEVLVFSRTSLQFYKLMDHAAKASGPQNMDNPRAMIRSNNSRENLKSIEVKGPWVV